LHGRLKKRPISLAQVAEQPAETVTVIPDALLSHWVVFFRVRAISPLERATAVLEGMEIAWHASLILSSQATPERGWQAPTVISGDLSAVSREPLCRRRLCYSIIVLRCH
jgi:hypothetical protein